MPWGSSFSSCALASCPHRVLRPVPRTGHGFAPLGPESAERELLEGMLEPEATMRLGITQVAAWIGRLLPELAASGKEPASSVATESTERSTAAGSISHLDREPASSASGWGSTASLC